MRRGVVVFALLCMLSVHRVTAQEGLTCFATTDFPKYTNEAQDVNVVFTIQAPSTLGGQAPLSLTSVLDRSGSMAGLKMDLLKKTTQFLVNKLAAAGGQHNLGIVTYANSITDLTTVVPVSSENSALLNSLVAGVRADGQTNLGGGLSRGVQQQAEAPGGKVKSVYLFTDGQPTVGLSSADEIVKQVQAIRNSAGDSITISTFGFGDDLNFPLLKQISDAGGGETYIIESENDIPAAFGDALGGLLSIAAQDIEVTLKPQSGVTLDTVQTGGDVSPVEGGIKIRFSNIYAEERRDIFIKLKIPAGEGVQPVLEIDTTYTDGPTLKRVSKDPVTVSLDRTAAGPVEAAPDKKVEETRVKFVTAEALSEAQSKVAQGDSAGAAVAIAKAEAIVNISPVKDDPTIQALSADIAKIKEILESQQSDTDKQAKVSELEQALSNQRSTSTKGEFQSATAVDTKKKQEIRQESKKEVLAAPPITVDPSVQPPTGPSSQPPAAEPTVPEPGPAPETPGAAGPVGPAPTTETPAGPAGPVGPAPTTETPVGPAGPVDPATTPEGGSADPQPAPAPAPEAPAGPAGPAGPAPTPEAGAGGQGAGEGGAQPGPLPTTEGGDAGGQGAGEGAGQQQPGGAGEGGAQPGPLPTTEGGDAGGQGAGEGAGQQQPGAAGEGGAQPGPPPTTEGGDAGGQGAGQVGPQPAPAPAPEAPAGLAGPAGPAGPVGPAQVDPAPAPEG